VSRKTNLAGKHSHEFSAEGGREGSNLSLPSHFVADLQLTELKSSVLSFYILVPSFLFKFST
jgi:hypothetical protein